MGKDEVNLLWDPGDFEMEHMSMDVAPRWNPMEGWFKKDVVQPMAALAEFTPYLASVAVMGPFEHGGGLRILSETHTHPNLCCICRWWWEAK